MGPAGARRCRVRRLPEPRYAHVDGDAIAWYEIGDGPETMVGSPGFFASVESTVESPGAVRLIERISAFRRLVLFDHRTTGLSDTMSATREPTVEDWVADVAAVMDATGRRSVDLFGMGVSVPAVIAAATMMPDRIQSLILIAGAPKIVAADDYPEGMPPAVFDGWRAAIEGAVDAPEMADRVLPSTVEDDRTFLRRAGQHGMRPRAARRLLSAVEQTDVRPLLPDVSCPTLLIHPEHDTFLSADCSRLMARRIPSNRLELLPTDDHVVAITRPDEVAALAETFLTGREVDRGDDRRLLTVLCTDIVDSTRRATAVGDAAWRTAIARFEDGSRERIAAELGTVVKFTGDGHLATFERPGAAVRAGREVAEFADALDLPVRVGIHVGEVEITGDDVLGVAVVIATRVMAFGGAGEIHTTSTVVDLVDGGGHRWEPIGEHELKGIERPRALWRLLAR